MSETAASSANASSATTAATTTTGQGATQTAQTQHSIPYERFAEVNQEASRLKARVAELEGVAGRVTAAEQRLAATEARHAAELAMVTAGYPAFQHPTMRQRAFREYEASVADAPADKRPPFDGWFKDTLSKDPLWAPHFQAASSTTATQAATETAAQGTTQGATTTTTAAQTTTQQVADVNRSTQAAGAQTTQRLTDDQVRAAYRGGRLDPAVRERLWRELAEDGQVAPPPPKRI